jgi:hypothetical protein
LFFPTRLEILEDAVDRDRVKESKREQKVFVQFRKESAYLEDHLYDVPLDTDDVDISFFTDVYDPGVIDLFDFPSLRVLVENIERDGLSLKLSTCHR